MSETLFDTDFMILKMNIQLLQTNTYHGMTLHKSFSRFSITEHSQMTSHVFGVFLTYLADTLLHKLF